MKRFLIALALLLASLAPAHAATTYTSALCMPKPTPGDPASQNTWGSLLNTGADIVDGATQTTVTVSVAGASNVVLTFSCGSVDQTDHANFIFTGVLTGNIYVLWPNTRNRTFSVTNSTTGAFTLGLGANNGGGAPAGSTTPVPMNASGVYYSDGTNVLPRVSAGGLTIGANSVVGNVTSGATAGADLIVPSCAGGLTYTPGTGFGCNNTFGGLTLPIAQATANSF